MPQYFAILRAAICGLLALGLLAAAACGAPAEQQAPAPPTGAEQQPAAPEQRAAQPADAQQAATTQAPAAPAPAKPTLALPSGMADTKAGGAAPTTAPTATPAPERMAGAPMQADLRIAITPPYAENLLGDWLRDRLDPKLRNV